MKRVLVVAAVIAGAPLAVLSQDAWVQVEAERTRAEAEARASFYATVVPDVAGFTLGSGWYAIALGPYSEAEASAALRRLRAQGTIPSDSYIVSSRSYRDRFWPAPGATPSLAPASPSADNAAPVPTPEPQTPDETVREARASESLLTPDDKKLLQTALAWAGHYSGAIDGLYGRGTRASMASWQSAQGFPDTGVLTTAQRAKLVADYNAVLDGMDLTYVESPETGIGMQIPLGVVDFDRFDPPFAAYGPSGDFQAQVLLISQQGDRQRMSGLYQIMQTLEIVPEDGPRALNRDRFVLEGRDDTRHSYTEVHLVGDQIKGFTLIWPAGDETRRARVLAEMLSSFQRLDGVLDPSIVPPSEAQSADLVSGLQVRLPRRTRSGMFIDARGAVLTSALAVDECGSIQIGNDTTASIAHLDTDLGFAVLQPDTALAPAGHAVFDTRTPRLGDRAALAGFPYNGQLPRAALTFGTISDLRDLNGDARFNRLDMTATPSEAGAPVMNTFGAVTGVLAETSTGKILPEGVAFALKSATLTEVLSAVGIELTAISEDTAMDAVALTDLGGRIAVAVRCWD